MQLLIKPFSINSEQCVVFPETKFFICIIFNLDRKRVRKHVNNTIIAIIIADDKYRYYVQMCEYSEQNISSDEKRDFSINKTTQCRSSLTESNAIFGAAENVKLSKKSTTVYARHDGYIDIRLPKLNL